MSQILYTNLKFNNNKNLLLIIMEKEESEAVSHTGRKYCLYISYKGLISRISKELKQINHQKTTKCIKTLMQNFETFYEESKIQMFYIL